MLTQTFKDKWLSKLTDGSNARSRGSLSSGNRTEMCVMGVARATAEEMHLLPEGNITDRKYLSNEELSRIGLTKDDQYYLASLNDIYIARDGAYPQRVINAIQKMPVMVEIDAKQPLLEFTK
jgi:hypothetical protein